MKIDSWNILNVEFDVFYYSELEKIELVSEKWDISIIETRLYNLRKKATDVLIKKLALQFCPFILLQEGWSAEVINVAIIEDEFFIQNNSIVERLCEYVLDNENYILIPYSDEVYQLYEEFYSVLSHLWNRLETNANQADQIFKLILEKIQA